MMNSDSYDVGRIEKQFQKSNLSSKSPCIGITWAENKTFHLPSVGVFNTETI